ncbi:rCG63420 [Rattus norvegicus]|uniref:RCG63420 n=1 Tax=Rattus norvegicus TaxID=10116 RepID=A6IL60_RAT|nr:rCG63420 [Rattus norvegicus]
MVRPLAPSSPDSVPISLLCSDSPCTGQREG